MVGTNLLTADEAEAMLRHVLEGVAISQAAPTAEKQGCRNHASYRDLCDGCRLASSAPAAEEPTERGNTISSVRAKVLALAEELNGVDLAQAKVFRNWEVCALLDEIDTLRGTLAAKVVPTVSNLTLPADFKVAPGQIAFKDCSAELPASEPAASEAESVGSTEPKGTSLPTRSREGSRPGASGDGLGGEVISRTQIWKGHCLKCGGIADGEHRDCFCHYRRPKFCWLLEQRLTGGSLYIDGPKTCGTDADKALWFFTQEEAEAYRKRTRTSASYEVLEHGFESGEST
jgi:hypothetical protein